MSYEMLNRRNQMDAEVLTACADDESAACVFFDPQYREIMDKMKYGNEGSRQIERAKLPQMTTEYITKMVSHIERILRPQGHLFLWMDKFGFAEGVHKEYLSTCTKMNQVDFMIWDKLRMGQGYRTRRRAEYLWIIQKSPKRAKDVWTDRGIPDVWQETVASTDYPHLKPKMLTWRLIEAVTAKGDLVVDPAAGSYMVMDMCKLTGREFLGSDIHYGGEG